MFLSKVYAKIVGDDEEAEERKRREEERREKRGNPLEGLPNCEITGRDFQVRPICHYGVPDSASCFAFDPLQRVVAIGSMDGMVKVFIHSFSFSFFFFFLRVFFLVFAFLILSFWF